MIMPDDEVKAIEALVARRSKPNGSGKQYPYRLVPFDELRPGTESFYLVDGVIPRAGLVAAWGPPKCGKSFWTFDLSMHVALGWPYRGRRVNGGPVAYLAFEGAEGFMARAEAFRRTHEITGKVPFFLLASNAKLVRDHKALIESINGQMDDRPPVAVVLDTLNRSIDGSESKDQDMGAYLAAAETICQEFDCAVLIVHHCGVDGSRPRGHTSLTGAVDAQLVINRDAANNVVVTVEAMKDGPEGARFASALKVIEVGIDDEERPITSCVIEPIEGDAAPKAGKSARLTGNQNRFLDILRDAIVDAPHEHKTTADIPGGRTAVSRQWLKMCCISKGWLDDDGGNKTRAKFSEMINTLAGKRIIGTTRLYVWMAQ
jgi:AAA domain